VTFETGGGAEIVLNQDGPTGQYLAVPSGSVQSGDSYFFAAVAQGDPNSSTAGALVGVERYTSAGGPQSFTLPAPWDYAGPTAAALPTFNFVYSGFSGSANVTDLANLTWFLGTGAIDEITMTSTANYQGGSTAMTVPDLSSLTGFLTPPTSGPVNWSANVYQGNFTDTKPLSGTIQYVGKNGAYTLP
jgi:hypothetical protein